ncbi:MAG TPA: hypothetical protein VND92_00090 [Vicinamibacterales bacterium]|nr:hypothetical protein [Vicinamibacterales bacterium]
MPLLFGLLVLVLVVLILVIVGIVKVIEIIVLVVIGVFVFVNIESIDDKVVIGFARDADFG